MPSKEVFVKNLAPAVTAADLREIFSEVGRVESVRVPINRESGRNRGFGFVELANEEAAALALANLNGRKLLGTPLIVRAFLTRDQFRSRHEAQAD